MTAHTPKSPRHIVDPMFSKVGTPQLPAPKHPPRHQPAGSSHKPKLAPPKSRGISNMDGFIRPRPLNQPTLPIPKTPKLTAISQPTRITPPKPILRSAPAAIPPRRPFAEGPLHMKHLPRPGSKIIQPRPSAVPARHNVAPQQHAALEPGLRMPVHQPGKGYTHSAATADQPTLDDIQALLATDQTPTLRTPLTARQKAKRIAGLSAGAIVGLGVLGGLSLYSQTIGQAALAVYAIVVLWRRWPSQRTFALALAMFAGIIITSLLSSANWAHDELFDGVSQNLAVYAFLLLCIGTISLAREVRQDGKSDK